MMPPPIPEDVPWSTEMHKQMLSKWCYLTTRAQLHGHQNYAQSTFHRQDQLRLSKQKADEAQRLWDREGGRALGLPWAHVQMKIPGRP